MVFCSELCSLKLSNLHYRSVTNSRFVFGGMEGGLCCGQLAADLVSRITPRWEILQQRLEQQVTTASETNHSHPLMDYRDTIQLARFHMAWVFKMITLCDQSERVILEEQTTWEIELYQYYHHSSLRWMMSFSLDCAFLTASVACCLNTEITQISVEWISESPAFGIPRIVSRKCEIAKTRAYRQEACSPIGGPVYSTTCLLRHFS